MDKGDMKTQLLELEFIVAGYRGLTEEQRQKIRRMEDDLTVMEAREVQHETN